MNIVDGIIVIFLVVALVRGRQIGFVRQLFSTAGFFFGLWLGALVQPHAVRLAHSTLSRALVTLAITLGLALIFLSFGEYAGVLLKRRFLKSQVNKADNAFGSLISGATLLVAIWIGAAVLAPLPFAGLQNGLRGSQIISWLDGALPSAPKVVAGIEHFIDPNGFPQVFTGGEPTPPPNLSAPSLASVRAAVQKDEASVVKIEGQGCGGIVEGSGFVVGNGLVATNAHVVAGVAAPYVAENGNLHRATAIWFDPNLDFAVLRVGSLAGAPLKVKNGNVSGGTPGAVLGYPGGGGLDVEAASVIDRFTAIGRNIYNEGSTQRNVYELAADVRPGNSGGPLIAADGSVIGVVFAESTQYNNIGYALTSQQILGELSQAKTQNQPVGTGTCAD